MCGRSLLRDSCAALINSAYVVEAFFKIGNRTSVEEILGLMRTGRFLVLDLDGRMGACRW